MSTIKENLIREAIERVMERIDRIFWGNRNTYPTI